MKRGINLFLFLLAVMVLGGCTTNKEFRLFNEDDSASVIKKTSDKDFKKDMKFEWKITKGDRISITAYNQSAGANQLNRLLNTGGDTVQNTVRVGDEGILIGNDGTVILPLVGKVKISGLTEIEAGEKLIKEYHKYLRTPYVTVKILNQKLFVLGEVRQPGTILVTNGTMTLYEALATSGDLTDDAMRTNIKIIRGNLRNPEVHEVNLTDMSTMRFASLMLQPNDVVYVQPRTMKAINKNFTDQLPFFELITQMMLPFVSYGYLLEGTDFTGYKVLP